MQRRKAYEHVPVSANRRRLREIDRPRVADHRPANQAIEGGWHMVEVVPLTLHIGAEIKGVDLTKPLPSDQLKAVRDAFLKWKVIFFRDQNLDHAQHVAMARHFGEPTIGHAVFGHVEGHPEIYSV